MITDVNELRLLAMARAAKMYEHKPVEVVEEVVDIPAAPAPAFDPLYTSAVISTELPYGVVDTETGELVPVPTTESIAVKAMAARDSYPEITEATIAAAVESVVDSIYTNSVIKEQGESAEPTPVRRGPKPKVYMNTFSDYFFSVVWEDGEPVLESEVEQILVVASRNTDPNTRVPIGTLLRCMKMPEITTNSVLNCLNKTRPQKDWVSDRYARVVAQACRNVIEWMQEAKDAGLLNKSGDTFNFAEDAQGYAEYCLLGKPAYTCPVYDEHGVERMPAKVYTEAERTALRLAAGVTRWDSAA